MGCFSISWLQLGEVSRVARRGRYATVLHEGLATAKLTLEGVNELCMPEYVAGTKVEMIGVQSFVTKDHIYRI